MLSALLLFYYLLHISPSVNLPISLMATGGVVHVCVPSYTYKNAYTAKNYPERTQRIHSFFILVMWHSLMGESKKKLQWILVFFQPQRGMLQAHDTSSLPTVTMRNKSKNTSFPSASVMVCICCSQLFWQLIFDIMKDKNLSKQGWEHLCMISKVWDFRNCTEVAQSSSTSAVSM